MTYTHTPMRSRNPEAFDGRAKAAAQLGAGLLLVWGGGALFVLFCAAVIAGPGAVAYLFRELPLIALPALVFTASVVAYGAAFKR